MAKHIFITGGVVSSLGKGINAASIGQVLKNRGLNVFVQKFDPYINVDTSLMSPFQHGEIFVTKDGAETDLDLGHYERFIDVELSKLSSVSTGKIYQAVIEKERKGFYKGETIQVIPHITDEIKLRLKEAASNSKADIIITEIGGTVGDIESLPFLEAIRQARSDFGYENTLYIHNTLVPYLKAAKEIKTKPTQHSVSELKSLGIQPDILMLRSELNIPNHAKEKIALFSGIKREAIFESTDVDVIYEQIINMEKAHIDDLILEHFKIDNVKKANLSKWVKLIDNIKTLKKEVNINIVGKYVSHHDAYLSLVEAINHAGYNNHVKVNFNWIDITNLKEINKDEAYIITGDCYSSDIDSNILSFIKTLKEKDVSTLILGDAFYLYLKLLNNKEDLILNRNDKLIGELTLLKNNKSLKERFNLNYKLNENYNNILDNDNFSKSFYLDEVLSIDVLNKTYFKVLAYNPEFKSRPLKPRTVFNELIKSLI